MKLINHIAAARKAAGLTQAQLAEGVEVSRKTINTIENSVFTPSTTLALKIARHFDMSVHDLFELKEGEEE